MTCGVYQWWTRDSVQRTDGSLCGMVWEQSSHLKCQQYKKIVDFRRTRNKSNSNSIMGEEVEVVEEHKYLGAHLDNGLDWRCNTDAVYKKGRSNFTS